MSHDPAPDGPGAPMPADETSSETGDLRAALDEARALAQLRTESLTTISAEIRTPLTGILGMVQLLLETPLDPQQRGLVEIIQSSSQSLVNLVNDCLDFSRMDAGKLEIECIDFDLRVTVAEVAALLAPLANEKSIAFDVRIAHDVPSRLNGDPGRIRQVLLNLCSNAIKFTDKGGVVIKVERLEEGETHVVLDLSVADTGIGIERTEVQRLFEAYEQGDPSIARRFGGTGLGLAISRRLVELMGGRVGVESEAGVGSTFWFRLTLSKCAEELLVDPAVGDELRGVRVLVAEPSRLQRESLAQRLRAWGCEIDEVSDFAEALAAVRSRVAHAEPHRIAIVDAQLPGGGAEEFGVALREDGLLKDTRLVMFAAAGQRGDAARARAAGYHAYLTRPIEWAELTAAMIEVMRQPAAPAARSTIVTRHSIADQRRAQTKVLLVEDNAVNQLVAGWTLRRYGCALEVVGTAHKALECLGRQRYELVLLDLQLPDGSGFDIARAIRAREEAGTAPRTPIIAMSGRSDAEDRARCEQADMDDFLPKPVDLGQMVTLVERWCAPQPRPLAATDPDAAATAGADTTPTRETDADAESARPEATPEVTPFAAPARAAVDDAGEPPHADAVVPAPALELPSWESLEVLDLAKLEESCMGIPSLRDALLNTFLGEVRPRLDRLSEAVVSGGMAAVEFEAHGLKSMCGTVGAQRCTELFARLEQRGRDGHADALPSLLKHVVQEVARAERAIGELDRDVMAA